MIEIGRLCVKLAGRDAGRTCVVVDVIDERHVLIDGDVRRRNCNLNHIEPLAEKIDLKKGASHSDVETAFKKLDLVAWSTKSKNAGERPQKVRKSTMKVSMASTAKVVKPASAKEALAKPEMKAGPTPVEKEKATGFSSE